ncbi:hypothetical protein H0H93_005164, partial [Arthromyces matolae]
DGPLNAVRKSVLSRDNVDEENWMLKMATRVLEAGEEWAKWRREGIKIGGGLEEPVQNTTGEEISSAVSEQHSEAKRKYDALKEDMEEGNAENIDDEEDDAISSKRGKTTSTRPAKRRQVKVPDEPPLGIYEPHTGL